MKKLLQIEYLALLLLWTCICISATNYVKFDNACGCLATVDRPTVVDHFDSETSLSDIPDLPDFQLLLKTSNLQESWHDEDKNGESFFSSSSSSTSTSDLGKFQFIKLLGYGAYGDVYLARDYRPGSDGNRFVAIKMYRNNGEDSIREYYFQKLFNQIERDGRRNDHVSSYKEDIIYRRYMIRSLGVYRDLSPAKIPLSSTSYFHAIVYEYLPSSLSIYSKSSIFQDNKESFLKIFFFKILEAASFLERNSIVHLDIKPGNIMVLVDDDILKSKSSKQLKMSKNGSRRLLDILINQVQIRLIDFGMSADLTSKAFGLSKRHQYKFGTGKYRSPEAYLGSMDLNHTADIWSIGIMMLEMATGESLFGSFGKPRHYIIPTLQSVYFGKGKVEMLQDKVWPGVSKLPGYKNYAALYKRLIVSHKFENDFEHREVSKVFGSESLMYKAKRRLDPMLFNLISQLLCIFPSDRLPASTALHHPYFADVM